jgi:hypothetical protein
MNLSLETLLSESRVYARLALSPHQFRYAPPTGLLSVSSTGPADSPIRDRPSDAYVVAFCNDDKSALSREGEQKASRPVAIGD